MTLRWRILSSLVPALPLAAATITGSIGITDSLLPAVRQGRDNSGVVVWLEPARAAQAPALPAARFEMRQKNKCFIPHVLAVPVGAAVHFPNSDPIFHSVFSNFSGQIFDFGLYPPGSTRSVTFTRTGVVRVFCNIHPSMSAVIVVLRSPFFAVSNNAGAFVIRDVPPGDYTLHVFHERATQESTQKLERRVVVGDADVALPRLAVSELGYLAEPHKNKYGLDYPPNNDAEGTYAHSHK